MEEKLASYGNAACVVQLKISDAPSLLAIAHSNCLGSGWKIEAGNVGNGNCGSKKNVTPGWG